MRLIAKYLLMMVTVLAVGAAQVHGLTRGFVCDCSGEPVEVESSICDAAACHPGHDHHNGDHHHGEHQDDDDCGGENSPEDQHLHPEATESIKLVPATPLILVIPALAEMDFSAVLARAVLLAGELLEHRAELKPPDDTGGNPPASVLVAETVVMLV